MKDFEDRTWDPILTDDAFSFKDKLAMKLSSNIPIMDYDTSKHTQLIQLKNSNNSKITEYLEHI